MRLPSPLEDRSERLLRVIDEYRKTVNTVPKGAPIPPGHNIAMNGKGPGVDSFDRETKVRKPDAEAKKGMGENPPAAESSPGGDVESPPEPPSTPPGGFGPEPPPA